MHPLIALRRQLVSAQHRQRALSDSFNRQATRNEWLTRGALVCAFVVASGGPPVFMAAGAVCLGLIGLQAVATLFNLHGQLDAAREQEQISQRLPAHTPNRPAA